MSESFFVSNLSFSPKGDLLLVALANGFATFTTSPLRLKFHFSFEGRRRIGVISASSDVSLVLISGVPEQPGFTDKDFALFDTTLKRVVFEASLSDSIKVVFVLKTMFAVSTRTELRIFTYDPPMLLTQLRIPNVDVVCDLIEIDRKFLAAVPGWKIGLLRLVSGNPDNRDFTIRAHDHPVAMTRLSRDGFYVVSASDQGTCIRLFNAQTGDRIGEFRRGSFRASIRQIVFSRQCDQIAITSSKGTVHIFVISETNSDQLSQQRSKLSWKPPEGSGCVISFGESDILMAASETGRFYRVGGLEKLSELSDIDFTEQLQR